MFELDGKNVLVTGASGGIGKVIAKVLHGAGASIAISGTRVGALEAVANELGDRVHIVPANLFDKDSVEALPKAAQEAMGSVDILINNAGITRDNLAMRMKDDEWDSVITVNLESTFRLSRAVLRGMMKARWGRIINITSVVGTTGNPGQVNYCSAKAGIVGMSKSLAQEVASRGITVNCIAPGFISTPMTDVLDDAQKNRILTQVPIGRLGDPAEIGSAARFLASLEAGYITGQTLHVNGGMAMI